MAYLVKPVYAYSSFLQSLLKDGAVIVRICTLDKDHLTKDDHGQKLVYPEAYIICRFNSYEVKKVGTDQVIEIIPIKQKNKIDIEDRVLCLKQYLESSPEILYKAQDSIEGNR